jgi:hypothetical protein
MLVRIPLNRVASLALNPLVGVRNILLLTESRTAPLCAAAGLSDRWLQNRGINRPKPDVVATTVTALPNPHGRDHSTNSHITRRITSKIVSA